MTSIIQHSVILNSQSGLRNANRLAREWAIAHAGAYQGQAQRELGGSETFRQWSNDNLAIRTAKLTTESFKQVQLFSINYDLANGSEPYTAYVMTYASSETEQVGGYCIAVATVPPSMATAELPWEDRAGPAALEQFIETVKSDRSRSSPPGEESAGVNAIDDLFSIHDSALVLTHAGLADGEFEELADLHSDWAAVVTINPQEQLALSLHLPADQLHQWVRAKIALFSRYADPDGRRLRMAETDLDAAMARVETERNDATSGVAGRNAIAVLKVLESLASAPTTAIPAGADADGDTADTAGAESQESSQSDPAVAQQRIYTLEDQLSEAEKEISELRDRLAQYEQYDAEVQPDDTVPEPEPDPQSVVDANRHTTVLDAMINRERFSRLRFLTHCEKPLARYGKPRPNGVEIVVALDAINTLAQAWYNTPNGNIGTWDNYFIQLAGWKHADDESAATMAMYGDKRSFSDQEHDRLVTITRHLTFQGSSSGLQIYFDRDDITQSFIVGYIGEHLPYATARS